MKVVVDRSKCISLGVCETVSAVFELDDDAELIVHEDRIGQTRSDELHDAVQSCPAKASPSTSEEDHPDADEVTVKMLAKLRR